MKKIDQKKVIRVKLYYDSSTSFNTRLTDAFKELGFKRESSGGCENTTFFIFKEDCKCHSR